MEKVKIEKALPQDKHSKNTEKYAEELLEIIMRDAIEGDTKDIGAQVQALTAYMQYRKMVRDDSSWLLEKIHEMSPEQLEIFEQTMGLKTKKDKLKSGKATLADVYSLPEIKKKGG